MAVVLCLACNDPVKPPDPQPAGPQSSDELIALLAESYRARDIGRYDTIYPSPEDSLAFFFYLDEPWDGTLFWDRAEELRIHRRMFQPESTVNGPAPVPQDLWPESIDIQLTRSSEWAERADLYRSSTNPQGADPARWRVTDAIYRTAVYWHLQGDTDYHIDGRSNFVVVERLGAPAATVGKFRLYRWEDLGRWSDGVAESASWSVLKELYR